MSTLLMGWQPLPNEDEIVDVRTVERFSVPSYEPPVGTSVPSSILPFHSSMPYVVPSQGPIQAPSPSAASSSNESLTYPPSHDSPYSHAAAPSSDRRAQRNRMRDPEWVPRPRNAFIIFRCQYSRDHSSSHVNSNGCRVPNAHTEKTLSKRAAEAWKHLPADEKEHFKQLAEQEKDAHARLHPHYRFRPMRRRSSGRRRHHEVASDPIGDRSGEYWEGEKSSSPEPPYSPALSPQTTEFAPETTRRRSSSVPLPADQPNQLAYSSPTSNVSAAGMKRSISETTRHPSSHPWHYPSWQESESYLVESPYSYRSGHPETAQLQPLPEVSPTFDDCSFDRQSIQTSAMQYTNIAPALLTSSFTPDFGETQSLPLPPQLWPHASDTPSQPSVSPFMTAASSLVGWDALPEPVEKPTSPSSHSIRLDSDVSLADSGLLSSRFSLASDESGRGCRGEMLGTPRESEGTLASSPSAISSCPGTSSVQAISPGCYHDERTHQALQAYAMGLNDLGLSFDYHLSSPVMFSSYDIGPPPDLDFSELFAQVS